MKCFLILLLVGAAFASVEDDLNASADQFASDFNGQNFGDLADLFVDGFRRYQPSSCGGFSSTNDAVSAESEALYNSGVTSISHGAVDVTSINSEWAFAVHVWSDSNGPFIRGQTLFRNVGGSWLGYAASLDAC